jgi:hypothetical protein
MKKLKCMHTEIGMDRGRGSFDTLTLEMPQLNKNVRLYIKKHKEWTIENKENQYKS